MDNDHNMRHRAPLFIAQVDSGKLRVIRATEQILVPENHAMLGNSGVCQISDTESWVTVAEGGVSNGQRKGENNKVLLAKITLSKLIPSKPNCASNRGIAESVFESPAFRDCETM
jgi:hypothetical protein